MTIMVHKQPLPIYISGPHLEEVHPVIPTPLRRFKHSENANDSGELCLLDILLPWFHTRLHTLPLAFQNTEFRNLYIYVLGSGSLSQPLH